MAEYSAAENAMTRNVKIFGELGIPTSGVIDRLANLYLDNGDLPKAERTTKTQPPTHCAVGLRS